MQAGLPPVSDVCKEVLALVSGIEGCPVSLGGMGLGERKRVVCAKAGKRVELVVIC